MRVLPLLSIPAFAALFVWRASWREFPWGAPWIYVVLSALLFAVYAVDKRAARRGTWRISDHKLYSSV